MRLVAAQGRRREASSRHTYVSIRCGRALEKGIREGLCQAMKPKMKTITAPALTTSESSGLRPPTDGSIIISARFHRIFGARGATGGMRRRVLAKGARRAAGFGASSTFNTSHEQGCQDPSAVSLAKRAGGPCYSRLTAILGAIQCEIARKLGGCSTLCGGFDCSWRRGGESYGRPRLASQRVGAGPWPQGGMGSGHQRLHGVAWRSRVLVYIARTVPWEMRFGAAAAAVGAKCQVQI
jgi:hypothetical protein